MAPQVCCLQVPFSPHLFIRHWTFHKAPRWCARMVCDDDGNCYRTHPPRYVERRYDEDDEYEDACQRRYYRPRYYAPQVGVYSGYGYYSRPAFGFSIGTSPW